MNGFYWLISVICTGVFWIAQGGSQFAAGALGCAAFFAMMAFWARET